MRDMSFSGWRQIQRSRVRERVSESKRERALTKEEWQIVRLVGDTEL